MPRTLFIISRRHRELYEYLKERFAGDEQVEVVLDRRGTGQDDRTPSGDAASSHERRTRPDVDTELATRSHAVITLP